MILAIVSRIVHRSDLSPNNWRLYTSDSFPKLFDQFGITLFPILSEKNIPEICKKCDGLIIPGSINHVLPHYYGAEPISAHPYKIDEYHLDQAAIRAFSEAGKPILGICAGLQSINVYFGGTLNQLIEGHNNDELHSARLTPGTFVANTYNSDSIDINTFHRQSAKEVAPGFTVSAYAEDGTVEAIEKGNIIGLQWHPEEMGDLEFFRSFINTFF